MHNEDWEKYNHEVEDYGFYTLASIEKETSPKRFRKYDNRIITELEQELDVVRFSLKSLYIFTFIWIVLVTIFIANISMIYAYNTKSEDTSETERNVQVTAEVGYTLGYKEISSTHSTVTVLVYGNYEKGFQFTDATSGEILYSYAKLPGDGVILELSKVGNLLFKPNY